MAFASELLSSARAVRARSVNLVYVSNGYALEDPIFRARLLRLAGQRTLAPTGRGQHGSCYLVKGAVRQGQRVSYF